MWFNARVAFKSLYFPLAVIFKDFFQRTPVKFETLVSAGESDVFMSLGNNGFTFFFLSKPQQVFYTSEC